MTDVNNNLETDSNKMQHDIDKLQSKYNKLNKEVEQLESNKTSIGSDLNQIHGEFEQINNSMEDILQKLNMLSEQYSHIGSEIDVKNVKIHSIKKFLSNSLKKMAVGTLCTVYAVADKTIEKTSCIRESLEDIAAEAQYANKKKKCPSTENS